MLTIYNRIKECIIVFDDSIEAIQINPMTYVEPAHFIINLKNGFNYAKHIKSCVECEKLMKAMSSNEKDWYIDYNDQKFALVTKNLGTNEYGKNRIHVVNSYFSYGSTIQLEVIPLNEKELLDKEKIAVSLEEYEKACVFRDMIKEMNEKEPNN